MTTPSSRPDDRQRPGDSPPAPEDGSAVVRRILTRAGATGDAGPGAQPPPGGTAGRDGEQLDLADRHALRRVAGLSTELEDVTEVEYRQLRLERVVLVGLWTGRFGRGRRELPARARRARRDGRVAGARRGAAAPRDTRTPAPTSAPGKAAELRQLVAATGADTVICDGELAPSQRRALEDVVKVKVIDRTALILDIFAQHAKSKEGKAQVELAQLEYLLPRLRGWGESMSRQAGGRVAGGAGIGSRGPGETKIELDRRRIRTRMARLRREIAAMKPARVTKRDARRRNAVAGGGDRRLHQRRKVQPAQPPDRGRGPGRGRAVRHPRPDRAAGRHPGRSRVHPHRHGGLRAPTAAPAGRGLPLDAGGGRRAPTWCCTWSTAATPTRRASSRPCGRCSPTSARPACPSWSWLNKADADPGRGAHPAAAAGAPAGSGVGTHRRGDGRAASTRWPGCCHARTSRWRWCCRSAAATWSAGCMPRGRC